MQERRPRAAISWSGGKDCCSALHRVAERFDVVAALTMFDEAGDRSRSHGLRPELVGAQVDRLGLKHVTRRCSWQTYNEAFATGLAELGSLGITHVIFGDIMFDDHRAWTERLCAAAGLTAVQPIWGESTESMLREFIDSGSEALIVTARAEFLDESWLGRPLTSAHLAELAGLGVDPCGERGEYHTFVVNSPLFDRRLNVRSCGHVLRSGCWALDLELGQSGEDESRRT
jgi:diphthine-ammonia ligase